MLKLDLLENAVSSLDEALRKYGEGRSGNDASYKFCILHLSHFMELVFKHYVTQAHPLLIYKNPFAKNINDDSFTIGLVEATQFLINEGRTLPKSFLEDLEWLKRLRNRIEHHKFEMDSDEVEETVGRLIHALHQFDQLNAKIDLGRLVSSENYRVFEELALSYAERVQRAEEAAAQAEKDAYKGYRHKEYMLVNFKRYNCPDCGHNTLISNADSPTGCRCTFCENEESEDIEVECDICGSEFPISDMHEDPDIGYICPHHNDPD